MIGADVVESNCFFTRAWEFWALRSRAGLTARLPGLRVAWMNVTWPICNLTFLAEPVEADLDSRVRAALEYAREHDRGWLLMACRDFLPNGSGPSPDDVFARHGLELAVPFTGMAADRLLPPRRPLPELEFRPMNDAETRRAYCEINAEAYGDPLDLVIEALGVEAFWGEGTFGFVGYAEGEPVTAANTILMDDTLYMSLVATRPEHQKKGYAEAVMRHSLARARDTTGLERTVLHATPAGLPLYLEMGYRPVTEFLGYAAGGGH